MFYQRQEPEAVYFTNSNNGSGITDDMILILVHERILIVAPHVN